MHNSAELADHADVDCGGAAGAKRENGEDPMKPKPINVKLNRVVLDREYYPRMNTDWPTVAKYKDAMAIGDKFPPIVVVKRGDEYVVLDGWHRVQAAQQLKLARFIAIVEQLPPKEWFFRAAELNSKAGRVLTPGDRAMIASRLLKAGFSLRRVAQLTSIPVPKLPTWIAERITQDKDGHDVPVKPSLAGLKGTNRERIAMENSGPIANASVRRTLDEFAALLRAEAVDVAIEAVRERCEFISEALGKLLKPPRRGRKTA